MLKTILGQETALAILLRAIKSNNIPHSYLFLGPDGIGKKSAAVEFAKALNCHNSDFETCEGCISCNKIDKSIHPDIIFIEPDGESIKIKQIREIQKKIIYKPFEGRKKVVILDDVHKMGIEAANSFLKTLEEPPDDTILILTCPNHSLLLPTITSRCQAIRFNLLPSETVKCIMQERCSFSESDAEIVAALSNGSPGLAANIDIEENKGLRNKALSVLLKSSLRDMDNIFQSAGEISSMDKNALYEFCDLLMSFVRDMAIINAGTRDHIINKWAVSELEKISVRLHPSSFQKFFHSIKDIKNAVRYNANKLLAIEVMMFKIAEIKGF